MSMVVVGALELGEGVPSPPTVGLTGVSLLLLRQTMPFADHIKGQLSNKF